MNALLTVLGITLIGVILWDFVITVVSAHAAGPLTRGWSEPMWRGLLALHQRRRIHAALSMAGPIMLILTVLVWYAGLFLGSWLVLIAHPGAVVSNTTGAHADKSQIAYFVPTTLSSLGYGDWVPSAFPWTTIVTSMALVATIVVTVTLSYVIGVLSAAIKRRSLASSVRALGEDPAALARHANLGNPTASMQTYLTTLASDIGHSAAQEQAYPVLRYFHSGAEESSLARAVLLLSDGFFVLRHVPQADRPSPGLQAVVTGQLTDFAAVTPVRTQAHPSRESQERYLRQCARSLDVDDGPGSELTAALPGYLEYRAGLIQSCHNDGWPRLE